MGISEGLSSERKEEYFQFTKQIKEQIIVQFYQKRPQKPAETPAGERTVSQKIGQTLYVLTGGTGIVR